MESVQIPDDDGVQLPVAGILEHPPVMLPDALGGTGVVVFVHLGHVPAFGGAQLHAVLALACDGQPLPGAVEGLPKVHGGSDGLGDRSGGAVGLRSSMRLLCHLYVWEIVAQLAPGHFKCL